MSNEVRRGADRFVTRHAYAGGPTTLHSFSFGSSYDPSNLGFAAMVAHNDENLPPGGGYPDHPHSDLEIVTWVLDGALRHTDSQGASLVLGPGDLLRTHAGSGIVHSETAEAGAPARFLQTWLRPDAPGGTPTFAHATWHGGSSLTEVVGPGTDLAVDSRGARLYLASAAAGTLRLPEADRLHVFVAAGSLRTGDLDLGPGDALRLIGEGGRELVVPAAATVSVWAFAH